MEEFWLIAELGGARNSASKEGGILARVMMAIWYLGAQDNHGV